MTARITVPQPICDGCWQQLYGNATPNRVAAMYRRDAKCAVCGTLQRSGIFVADHPATSVARRRA